MQEGFEGLETLEQQPQKATKAEEYVDVTSEVADQLEASNDLLKETVTLLEYISNPSFCKNITKRERDIIVKHVERLEDLIETNDQTIEEQEELEAEDEDEDEEDDE